MKIDSQHPLTRPAQSEGPQQSDKLQQSETQKAAGAGVEAGAQAHLSRPAADTSQDIDSARVEQIRDAIREGRLEIHPERIADGLIDSVRDMLGDGSEGSQS
ncbi:flagellar biosynthesis anti-sigma factor FlgM [Halomonas sp. MMSF_3323]|uniref:flagellar biosynthesis anti-sigma factor FlgM n=1 Tax=unclassified Halomonas TaxID=2609666 RepID=UPI001E147C1E|nr:flagellar biosynthesis anti-sigma factor FlgM [Halomonas sp. MMSF_3323]MBR9772716.1 flagellar biosynthesis anti-sigma factor FlgM [Gammaproteobacteria bacterium]MCO7217446.1 flagellar biosynthesis anti-sigma factor FlgM [Halomonas sp. OfavH-34-E]